MHTDTGDVFPLELIPHGQEDRFVEVKRTLTEQERYRRQIDLYSPCGCGSGIKMKWCCHKKRRGGAMEMGTQPTTQQGQKAVDIGGVFLL